MRRYLTPRWLLRHLVMVVLVAGCLGLGWWQIGRAAGGNALSFGYACEWPVFALFVTFIWWREIRLERHRPAGPPPPAVAPAPDLLTSLPARPRPVTEEDSDPQLRAYNEYLAWLNEDPTRRPADYPGRSAEPETRSR